MRSCSALVCAALARASALVLLVACESEPAMPAFAPRTEVDGGRSEPDDSSGGAGRAADDSDMTGDAGMAGADAEPIEDAGQLSNPLLGAWLDDHGTCQYVHTFDDQGVYTISSTTGEYIKASYRIQAPAEPDGRFSLHFVVSTDNNVVDCEGDMIDETGEVRDSFVEVVDADHVDIYLSPTDGAVFIALTRR